MRKFTLIISGFLIFSKIHAQIPSGYYSSVTTQTGASLKTLLYNIIKGHTAQSYTPGLWDAYYTTDVKPNGNVWDMYSNCDFTFGTAGNQDNGTQGTAECQKYNREHSFPKSWFGNSSPSSSVPPSTDLFHVIPSDKYVNSKRGNMPYGEVGSINQGPFGNGTKIGICTSPGFSGTVFEPVDDYKGDFSRAYLYMATRYETDIASWEKLTTDGDAVMNGTSFPAYEIWYLNLLFKWHNQDPVSQKEIDRNNAIYAIQNNRNPYIDHPEYAGLIWSFTSTGMNTTPGINHTPVAQNLTLTGTNTSTLTGYINTYISDADSDPLTITEADHVLLSGGFVNLSINGFVSYKPNATFTGSDQYTYSVCDATTCSSGLITFIVLEGSSVPGSNTSTPGNNPGNNHPPITKDLTLAGLNTSILAGYINSYISDTDNDRLTITGANQVLLSGGSVSLSSGGYLHYQPNITFTGSDHYTYLVCDINTCSSGLITFIVFTGSLPGTNTLTGIDNKSTNDQIFIYPNPAGIESKITISTGHSEHFLLEILNYEGKTVYSQSYSNQSNFTLPAMSLPPGLFLIKIIDKNSYFVQTARLSVIH